MTSLALQKLSEVTDNFSQPVVISDCPHPYELSMVQDCFNEMAASLDSKGNRHCRAYIDGRQLTRFEVKALVIAIASYDAIEQVDWDLLVGKEEFLIFLNFAALYSARLLAASRQYVGQFCNNFSPHGLALEHHLIIGRYSETPFGVHVDDATDRTLHFNLGPAPKEMILWPRQDFLDAYPNDSALPLAQVTHADGTVYPMAPMSCFHLPADFYHVGRSPFGVSAVVVLALSRQSPKLRLQSALDELKNIIPMPDVGEDLFRNFYSASNDVSATDNLPLLEPIDIGCLIRHAEARRRSNGGMAEVRMPLAKDVVELRETYKICTDCGPVVESENAGMHIFSRGHHATLTNEDEIQTLEEILRLGIFRICDVQTNSKSGRVMALLAWLVMTESAIKLQSSTD